MVKIPNEITIRIVLFITIFALAALWAILAPRRALTTSKKIRWVSNLGITFLNPLVLHLAFPILAVDMALKAGQGGWGLLNNVSLSFRLKLVSGIIVLDLVIYLQHVMFHVNRH